LRNLARPPEVPAAEAELAALGCRGCLGVALLVEALGFFPLAGVVELLAVVLVEGPGSSS
jgi:hypothetical protein